jgi:hypothetical protein
VDQFQAQDASSQQIQGSRLARAKNKIRPLAVVRTEEFTETGGARSRTSMSALPSARPMLRSARPTRRTRHWSASCSHPSGRKADPRQRMPRSADGSRMLRERWNAVDSSQQRLNGPLPDIRKVVEKVGMFVARGAVWGRPLRGTANLRSCFDNGIGKAKARFQRRSSSRPCDSHSRKALRLSTVSTLLAQRKHCCALLRQSPAVSMSVLPWSYRRECPAAPDV